MKGTTLLLLYSFNTPEGVEGFSSKYADIKKTVKTLKGFNTPEGVEGFSRELQQRWGVVYGSRCGFQYPGGC